MLPESSSGSYYLRCVVLTSYVFCAVCGVPVALVMEMKEMHVLPRRTAQALPTVRRARPPGGKDQRRIRSNVRMPTGICVCVSSPGSQRYAPLLLYMLVLGIVLYSSLYRSEFVDWGYSVR
jgi:hypothetical protein